MITFIKKTFSIAYQALSKQKVRTALTVLGITVGITVVIVVLSAGQAIDGFITSQVTTFGTDYLAIEIKVPTAGKTSFENASGRVQGITITTLKEKDGEQIKKHPNISNVYAAEMALDVASYQGENKITNIFGASSSFIDIDPGEIEVGRFYDEAEDKSLAKVVVLGSSIKESLFANQDPIGKKIRIKKRNFEVIGVIKERGGGGFFSMDDMIFMPLNTLQKQILGTDYVSFIYAQLIDNSLSELTADDINILMRDLHNISDPDKDDFSVTSSDEALELLGSISGAIQLLLFAIALISLIVGGVGIMNVMYVSVAERTFEIGLRKALGARNSNILNQFLAEAVMVTFMGGIVGSILGAFLAWFVGYIANQYGFAWEFNLAISYFALAVGASVIVGLVSGIFPAIQASKLDPIVALRKE